MKIGIIAASGKSGQAITQTALQAGYQVVALVRDPKKMHTLKQHKLLEIRTADLNQPDCLKQSCHDIDILISAYGPNLTQVARHDEYATTLINLLTTNTQIQRLLVIGGVGSLLNQKGEMIIDTAMYLPEWRVDGSKQVKALEIYHQSKVNWTYFSPAFWYEPELPLTNDIIYGTDYLLYNQAGESKLGYLDTAMILINEIKAQKYIQKRFTACRA